MKITSFYSGLTLIFCALSGTGVWAQTNVASTTVAPASRLAPTDEPDGQKYQRIAGKLNECKAQVAAFQSKPCDIIFIGDSITAGWRHVGKATWDKFYVPRRALDFGVSGDQTQNVLWRMDNLGIASLKPKVAVIMIGTNNTAYTPQEIAVGVKAIITKTQAFYPGVKVVLMSVTPNKRANEKMMAVNGIIRNFADQNTIYFVDLVPLMPPVTATTPDGKSDTNYKGLSADHLHPDASGYQIWAEAMEPVLSKLLGESTK